MCYAVFRRDRAKLRLLPLVLSDAISVILTVLIVATVSTMSAAFPRDVADGGIGFTDGGWFRRSFGTGCETGVCNRNLIDLAAKLAHADGIVAKPVSIDCGTPNENSRFPAPVVLQVISRDRDGGTIESFGWDYALRVVGFDKREIKTVGEIVVKRFLIDPEHPCLGWQCTGVGPVDLKLLSSPFPGWLVEGRTESKSAESYDSSRLFFGGVRRIFGYLVKHVGEYSESRREDRSPRGGFASENPIPYPRHLRDYLLFLISIPLFISTVGCAMYAFEKSKPLPFWLALGCAILWYLAVSNIRTL